MIKLGPEAQLTQLVTAATRAGMSPQPFKKVLKTPADVTAADNAWTTRRINQLELLYPDRLTRHIN